VTIFGQSSGGASVAALLSAPAGRGLFCRAIVQSAGATPLLTAPDARLVTADLAARLNVAPTAAAFTDIDTVTVIAAQQAVVGDLSRHPDPVRWGHSVVATGGKGGGWAVAVTAAPTEIRRRRWSRHSAAGGSTLEEHHCSRPHREHATTAGTAGAGRRAAGTARGLARAVGVTR
jgi:hypothetical protein